MTTRSHDWLALEGRRVDLVRGTVVDAANEATLSTLTTIERKLLAYLARNAERAVSRDELLHQVWGYQGQIVTRTVDVAVRRLRSKLELDPGNPRHIVTVHGHGYRFAGPVAVAIEPVSQPLPAELTPLVGRDALVHAVQDRMREGARLVTLTGAGGAGKSRVAIHIAHQHRGPSAWAELADARDPRAVLVAVASSLGVYLNGSTVPAAMERVGRALKRQPSLLLVLDNGEAVAHELPALLTPWLSETDTTFLLTSRVVARMAGEHVVDVGPLSVEAGTELYTARRMQRTHSDADGPAVASLVRALDGNALAIELAAARAAVLPPSALLERLDDRLSLLQVPAGQVQHRHGSLRAVIDASWSLLSERERSVASRCSVFRGGFDLHAVDVIVGSPSIDVVESLVDHSLVRVIEAPSDIGGVRFRMDETVRAFAAEQLSDDAPALHNSHAQWACALGLRELARLRGPDGRNALERLHIERDNLLAALYGTTDPALALGLGRVWQALGTARGPLSVRDDAVSHALTLGADGPGEALAELLIARLEPMRSMREVQALRADIARAREGMQTASGLAKVDVAEAELCYRLGEVDAALDLVRAALPALPAGERTDAHVLVGRCLLRRDGPDAARSVLADAVTEAVREGDRLGEARARFYGAFVEERAGNVELAAQRIAEARTRYADVGDVSGEATTRVALAGFLLDHGQADAAEHELAEAIALAQRVGDLYSEGIAFINTGNLHLSRSEHALAESAFREAVSLLHRQGAPADSAVAMANLGIMQRDTASLQAVVDQCEELELTMLASLCWAWLSALHAAAGELTLATSSLQRARDLSNAASRQTVEVLALALAHAQGEPADAVRAKLPGPDARVDERVAAEFVRSLL